MIEIQIPGFKHLRLDHLVLDYNGTLALDGTLLPGVRDLLTELSGALKIHVITADTFGLASSQLDGLPVTLTIAPLENQADTKLEFVNTLGAEGVAAIGNGRNDRKMLKAAALGVAVLQKEGGAVEALASADLATTSVTDALALLQNPKRLIATLRS